MTDLTPITSSAGDGALIEDLTRRAVAANKIEAGPMMLGGSTITRVVREDERIEVINLERLLISPERHRGTATLYDPVDFSDYVARLRDTSTTVWADEKRGRVTAVFNDHHQNYGGVSPAGWRDHTAVLELQPDPEWLAFLALDGKYLSQVDFAEFLTDHDTSFVRPDGATMLEVASSFRARRKAEFSSAVNLDNGDLQLTYNEETTPQTIRSGQIEVPREFVVQLTPYLGYPLVELPARLRWNLDGGTLRMGFKLRRPDLVKQKAFADIRSTIAGRLTSTDDAGITTPVLLGPAPNAVTPQQ